VSTLILLQVYLIISVFIQSIFTHNPKSFFMNLDNLRVEYPQEQNINIETKELKGLNLKSLYWIIGSTIISCVTILTSVYGIKSSITDVKTEIQILQLDKANDKTFNEYRLSELTARLKSNEDQIAIMKRTVNELEAESLHNIFKNK
jgi:hypothetical protein